MKVIFFLLTSLSAIQSLSAQPQPQQPPILPKHEIAKPTAQVKTFPPLSQYIYTGNWKGDISWATADAGFSFGIKDITFSLLGEVNWQLAIQEIVVPQPGTFNVNGNDISFSFNYSPYKYSFKGVYNKNLGKINGTFTQTRMRMLNAPAGYTPGTISGTFKKKKK